MSTSTQRRERGKVHLWIRGSALWLRFTVLSRRYSLNLHLPNTEPNRAKARIIAATIEADITTGSFDPSLARYQPDTPSKPVQHRLHDVFDCYASQNADRFSAAMNNRIQSTRRTLARLFPSNPPVEEITWGMVHKFITALLSTSKPSTIRGHLGIITRSLRSSNLPTGAWENHPLPRSKPNKPKPFTPSEVQQILEYLSKHHPGYRRFTLFLLSTGVRISEAIALRWEHLDPATQTVTIAESIGADGKRKGTKTGNSRIIALPPDLWASLGFDDGIAVHPSDCPVFTTTSGRAIQRTNFRSHIWKPMLADLGVPYRYPYSCRHTFISYALQSMPITQVAAITGHTPTVMLQHYASSIGLQQVPRLW